jgi:hypothetical protein
MPTLNNGSVTLGWDSIESGVDQVELKRPALAQRPIEPDYEGFERLIDIANIVSRARRDARDLVNIIKTYGLEDASFAQSTHKIADQTLATVRRLA